MNEILEKLSEIELAANKVIEAANEKKPELAAAMKQKTEEFDRHIDNETAARIAKQHAAMEKQNTIALSELEQSVSDTLNRIEKSYNANHNTWADEITARIIAK